MIRKFSSLFLTHRRLVALNSVVLVVLAALLAFGQARETITLYQAMRDGKATLASTGRIIPFPGTVEALRTYLTLEPKGNHAEQAQVMLETIGASISPGPEGQKSKK